MKNTSDFLLNAHLVMKKIFSEGDTFGENVRFSCEHWNIFSIGI